MADGDSRQQQHEGRGAGSAELGCSSDGRLAEDGAGVAAASITAAAHPGRCSSTAKEGRERGRAGDGAGGGTAGPLERTVRSWARGCLAGAWVACVR